MTAITPPGPDPQGTHHWLMTVQWPAPRRWPCRPAVDGATYGGTTTPQPGQTRSDVYENLRDHVCNDLARTVGIDGPTIVHWSLEPNRLGGAQ